MERDYNHHLKESDGWGAAQATVSLLAAKDGYGPRISDPAYLAIRGAEQLQIERYRELGISVNSRNGIGLMNDMRLNYLDWGSWLLEGLIKW